MIERTGIEIEEIIECSNGEEALNILQERDIDVMFTDIRMPKMDGIALVDAVSHLDVKPLITAVSGFDDFKYAVEMMRNGVQEYILKPVDREKILEVLQKFEKQLSTKMDEETKRKNMAMQQLKYMLFYDDVTSSEIENICNEVGRYIPYDSFCAICFASKPDDDNDFVIPGHSMFIQGQDCIDILFTDIRTKMEILDKYKGYHIGVSRTYYNLMDLKQAYCEAAEMRRESFVGGDMVIDASLYTGAYDKKYQYGVKVMMQTANLICSNKLTDALKQLEVFVAGVKAREYSTSEFHEQMEIIINTILKVYNKSLKNKEKEVMELLDIYSFQTIDDYMDVVRKWIENFDELVSDEVDERKTSAKMQKAVDYINENYAKDLNMAVVSNYISMNYSLFSFTFKQYTGTNFVNYLKNIRVGEAKKLLTETDMKVNEISQAVGYDHEKHFMKTFKTLTGLTPTQYRNNLS